jgi:hypothetical protein
MDGGEGREAVFDAIQAIARLNAAPEPAFTTLRAGL